MFVRTRGPVGLLLTGPLGLLLLPFASGSELRIHPEVERALAECRPVVALESTIISHGMPYPDNLRISREVEEVARSCGATPSTIAVLDGVSCIGLTVEDPERFAKVSRRKVPRHARCRDLAHTVARDAHGGPTVSSTMLPAHKAGIAVIVTGGISGVHRGGERSMAAAAKAPGKGAAGAAVEAVDVLAETGGASGLFARPVGSKAGTGGDIPDPPSAAGCAPPVVVGGAVVDVVCLPNQGTALLPRTSTPGHLEMTSGGVARNVADGLARRDGLQPHVTGLQPHVIDRAATPCNPM